MGDNVGVRTRHFSGTCKDGDKKVGMRKGTDPMGKERQKTDASRLS